MDKRISDLEHALIKKEIENMSFKVHEAFISIEKNINLNFEALRIKSDAETEVMGVQLDNILLEQKKTNGRITVQEKVTGVLRIMQENRWLTALVLYAIYNALEYTTVENIIRWIKYFI